MRLPRSVWDLAVIVSVPVAAMFAGVVAAQPANPTAITLASNQPIASPASGAPSRPPLGESVAAIVNDELISSYDLRQRMRLLVTTSGIQPTAENLPQIEREALRSLVDERLEMQEVHTIELKQKDLHLEPSDRDVESTIGDMAKQSGVSEQQLIETLRGDDVDVATLREQIRARMSWEHYISARFRDSVEVADNQVRAAFERANSTAMQPQYLLSEIFIGDAQVGGREAATEGARQLIEQLKQGAAFTGVARQFSSLPTAANGGDAGWITASALLPELEAAAAQMRPGQLSQPIPVSNGVYIIALRDRRAGADTAIVDIKQAAISLASTASGEQVQAAQTKLEALRGKINGCESVEERAAKFPGVVAGDLGETEVKDLRSVFQQAIANLKVGEVSAPVRTDVGLHLIVLCERHASGARAVTRADVEDRLKGEQFEMFARRFLRDLRNSATIETR